jgi:hypothetical protein
LWGTSPQGTWGLVAQAAVRLDGTDFAGANVQAAELYGFAMQQVNFLPGLPACTPASCRRYG